MRGAGSGDSAHTSVFHGRNWIMVIVALWSLVVVAAGFFVACLLDDLLDAKDDQILPTSNELDEGAAVR